MYLGKAHGSEAKVYFRALPYTKLPRGFESEILSRKFNLAHYPVMELFVRDSTVVLKA
jgi:hypothetical protein